MRHLLKKKKRLMAAAALLAVVSGCVGAVGTTTKELQKEAAAPINAPIESYGQGK